MTSNRIQSLEVLRGLAALAVAWFHITYGGKVLAEASNPLLKAAAAIGSIGYHITASRFFSCSVVS